MPTYHPSRITASRNKALPWHPTTPHHNTAWVVRNARQSGPLVALSSLGRRNKGCQPTMRNAAVCRNLLHPGRAKEPIQSSLGLKHAVLQVMSGTRLRVGSVVRELRPVDWALGWSAVIQSMRGNRGVSDAGTGVAVRLFSALYSEGALGWAINRWSGLHHQDRKSQCL
jgi:hypothetical protein